MMSMIRPILLGSALALLCAGAASAHHVIWLDFGSFNLSNFATVNGHTPPTSGDRTAIQDLVFQYVSEDFAAFDIQVVRFQPVHGFHTRVIIRGTSVVGGGLVTFGCASGSCCAGGNCTGGPWNTKNTACEVYAGSFGSQPTWRGSQATSVRIARAIANVASHEAGHILGLSHCHSAGDFVSSGRSCSDGYAATSDLFVNSHIMGSGSSTSMSQEEYASNLFFSVRSSRRVLYRQFQSRNHFERMPSFTADGTDHFLGHFSAPRDMDFFGRVSTGTAFGSLGALWTNAGEIGDLFFNRPGGLWRARATSSSVVRWDGFGAFLSLSGPDLLRTDAGDLGSLMRWGDVNGDGFRDLVVANPRGATVPWQFFRATDFGRSLAEPATLSLDAGNEGDLFFLSEETDGSARADLVAVRRNSALSAVTSVLLYRSTGTSLVLDSTSSLGSFAADYVFVDDVDGDGEGDVILGRVTGDTTVQWYVSFQNEGTPRFLAPELWASDRGDAGTFFRTGDGDGDLLADLFYAMPIGRDRLNEDDTSLVLWQGARSTGSSFGSATTWSSDSGNEGDLFP